MLRSLRNVTIKSPLRSVVPLSRSITYTAVRMGEGDTGGTRAGGAASSDAFTKREAASETQYVREKELEKLRELRAKIEQQREHLDTLSKKLEDEENKGKGN